MATTRRVKRNIKEDQLVTTAVRLSQWAQEHFTHVIIGVVALVLIIVGVVFTSSSKRSAGELAQQQMSSAMSLYLSGDYEAARTSFEQIRERHGGTQGSIAQFFKAESEFKQGNYEVAAESYDLYLAKSGPDEQFRHSAVIGKALCQEGREDYAAASETLAGLLTSLDRNDPRFLDASYMAGEFFARAGNMESAAAHFRTVIEEGTGPLKMRAQAAIALVGE